MIREKIDVLTGFQVWLQLLYDWFVGELINPLAARVSALEGIAAQESYAKSARVSGGACNIKNGSIALNSQIDHVFVQVVKESRGRFNYHMRIYGKMVKKGVWTAFAKATYGAVSHVCFMSDTMMITKDNEDYAIGTAANPALVSVYLGARENLDEEEPGYVVELNFVMDAYHDLIGDSMVIENN